jgi:mono/diheme cytochrome c family protein
VSRWRTFRASTLAALACAALACGGADEGAGLDEVAARGKTVYENVCTACHNRNPREGGALGPAIAGASQELLEAKVLRAEYPPGYAPKLPSATMPKFEYLAGSLGDIAAYLATIHPNMEPQ